MAILSGRDVNIQAATDPDNTENLWAAPDNQEITGDIIVNLTENFTPTGRITTSGALRDITFTATTPVTVDLRGVNMASEIGHWIIANNNVTLLIDDRDNLGLPVTSAPTADSDSFLQFHGGTFRVRATGANANVIFEDNAGIYSANALQAATIDIDIDDMQGSSTTNASGGSLTLNRLTGTGGSAVNITGGDSLTYVPSLILLNYVNNGDSVTMNVARGVGVEFRNSQWGGPINLSGDLKGTGTISGSVNSTGGRISPGNAVGGSLTFLSRLALDGGSHLYFGIEDDGNGNYRGDSIIIDTSGSLNITDATIFTIPYNQTIENGTFTLIDIDQAALVNISAFNFTNDYTNLPNYLGDNNPRTDTTPFNHTAAISSRGGAGIDQQDIVLTLS